MTVPKTIKAEYDRAMAAEKALSDRIAALEKPPVTPPSGRVIGPADKIGPLLLSGERQFVLRGGTYHESFGSVDRHEGGVSLTPYGDSPVIFDGTGLAQNWLYLGTGASWTLGAIWLQNFRPTDSGILAVGDACYLETSPGFKITGKGQPKSSTVPYDINSHGVYAHGTGTYHLIKPDITGIPGAALHHYRGTPKGVVDGGRLGAFYESAIVFSGFVALNGVTFAEPTAAWDIQVSGDATGTGSATLATCIGTGTGGAVRRSG